VIERNGATPGGSRSGCAGDQLLAGAALAVDQEPSSWSAPPLDEREDRLHPRALAMMLLKGVFLLQLAPQVDVLATQLGLLERLLGDDFSSSTSKGFEM